MVTALVIAADKDVEVPGLARTDSSSAMVVLKSTDGGDRNGSEISDMGDPGDERPPSDSESAIMMALVALPLPPPFPFLLLLLLPLPLRAGLVDCDALEVDLLGDFRVVDFRIAVSGSSEVSFFFGRPLLGAANAGSEAAEVSATLGFLGRPLGFLTGASAVEATAVVFGFRGAIVLTVVDIARDPGIGRVAPVLLAQHSSRRAIMAVRRFKALNPYEEISRPSWASV